MEVHAPWRIPITPQVQQAIILLHQQTQNLIKAVYWDALQALVKTQDTTVLPPPTLNPNLFVRAVHSHSPPIPHSPQPPPPLLTTQNFPKLSPRKPPTPTSSPQTTSQKLTPPKQKPTPKQNSSPNKPTSPPKKSTPPKHSPQHEEKAHDASAKKRSVTPDKEASDRSIDEVPPLYRKMIKRAFGKVTEETADKFRNELDTISDLQARHEVHSNSLQYRETEEWMKIEYPPLSPEDYELLDTLKAKYPELAKIEEEKYEPGSDADYSDSQYSGSDYDDHEMLRQFTSEKN